MGDGNADILVAVRGHLARIEHKTDARLELMQEAMKDELFLADLHECMDDFRYIDAEETAV